MCESPLRANVPNLFAGSPPGSPEKFNGTCVVEETTQETSIFDELSRHSENLDGFYAPPLPKSSAGLVDMRTTKKRVFRNLCGDKQSGTITFCVKDQVDTAEQGKLKRPSLICYRKGLEWGFDEKKAPTDMVFGGPELPPAFEESRLRIIERKAPVRTDPDDRLLTPVKTQLFCVSCHVQSVKAARPLCDSPQCKTEPVGAEYLITYEDRYGNIQTKRSPLGFANVVGFLRSRRQARIMRLLKGLDVNRIVVIPVNSAMAPIPITVFLTSENVINQPLDIAHRRRFGNYERIVRAPNSAACESLLRRLAVINRLDTVTDFGDYLLSPDIEWYGIARFVVRQFIHSEKEGGAVVASTF